MFFVRWMIAIIGVALLAILGRLFVIVIPASGIFANLEPILVNECTRLDVAPGTEDIVIDHENGLAYIGAGERREWLAKAERNGSDSRNGVYVFKLGAPETLRRITPPADDFLPHGIDLWIGPDGERRIFVVNHPSTGEEFVEIYDASAVATGGDLMHLRSVSFNEMHSPNDIVAVGPEQFYATNDEGHISWIPDTAELYLGLPLTNVVYFDGNAGQVVAKGLIYANGINASADGASIYVAELLARRITVFDRDAATYLVKRAHISIPTAPDNIDVDENGDLWIAGHSKLFDIVAHAADATKHAPSHVVRVDPKTGANETLFVSTEGELSASSISAAYDGGFLVGAVFDGHILDCPSGSASEQ